MKKIFFSTLVLLFSVTSFSQIIVSQNSNYCHFDNVSLVLMYNQSFNTINWEVNDGGGWSTINADSIYSGILSDTLIIQNVENSFNSNQYRAIIDTGAVGSFEVNSDIFSFSVYDEFLIGILSGDETICFNTPPSQLSAPLASGGEGTYSYQWYKDGNIISGATSSTYQPLALTSTSNYSVEVSDLCGSLTSNSITVTVLPDFLVGSLLGSQTICFGDPPSTLTSPSISGGEGTYSYQWYKDGSIINGATSSTYQSGPLFITSQFSLEITDDCGQLQTNSVTITVYPDVIAGQITGGQTICYNTVPSSLTFSSPSSGGQGTHSYQWQSSTDALVWSNENGATGTTFSPSSLQETTHYRVRVTDSCEAVFTNEITISVYDEFLIGILSGDETICFNTPPSQLSAPLASGGEGTYSYQWYKDGNIISGATSSTYQPLALTSTSNYSVEVSDLCNSITSNSIQIFVLDDLFPGIIIGDSTICYNTTPSDIAMTQLASGGANVSYVYQWQSSSNGVIWNDIIGASNNILSTGLLTTSTYYRLEVYSGVFNCGPKYTNSVFIEVQDPFTSGALLNQNICFNTSTVVSYQQLPTGGFETYNYQWQISNNQINWVNVGSDQDNHVTSNHSSDVYYQVIVSDVCGQLTSNTSFINVYDSLQAGTILASDTVCYNSMLNPVDANFGQPIGGDLTYTYDWYHSNDGVNFNLHSSSNSILNIGNLQDTTFIYVDYTSGGNCGTVSSNILEVVVFPEVDPGSITGDTAICFNTNPGVLSMNMLPTGGGDLFYNYQWQESLDNQNWTNINSANLTTYQPSALTSSTYYRLEVYSGQWNCGPRYTNTVFIEVFDEFVNGSLEAQATICYNTTPNIIEFDNLPIGADGDFSYSWEINNAGSWIQLNEFSSSYQPNLLTSDTEYRVLITSNYGCGSAYNQITISVYDSLVAGEIDGDDVICYDEVPDLLSLTVDASGGGDSYVYSWNESNDQQNWVSSGTNNTTYQPQNLFETTFYYLEFSSNENCGSVLSNVVEVIVNPLPDTVDIIGPSLVCGNSTDVEYTMSFITYANSFSWSLNAGSFIGSTEDDYVFIHFDDFPQNDVLYLEQTVNATGCSNVMEFNIEVSSDIAPDQGVVIKKPNTNILITSDSTLGITYEWGFTEINTGVETILSDTNRYALMPHIDINTYWYWVDTYFDNSCITRSYYSGPPIPTEITEDHLNVNLYPNPTKDWLYIETEYFTKAEVYSLQGKLLAETFSNKIDLQDLNNGVYVVKVYLENRVLTSKILKK